LSEIKTATLSFLVFVFVGVLAVVVVVFGWAEVGRAGSVRVKLLNHDGQRAESKTKEKFYLHFFGISLPKESEAK